MKRQQDSGPAAPRILFIGKRFYTNKDALAERFGRIYQLPFHWARRGRNVRLWLVDYHSRESLVRTDARLLIKSAPALSLDSLRLFASASTCWRPDFVVASGDCYIGLLGWILARLSRARFVFDVYDKYDEFPAYRRLFGVDLFAFLRRRSDVRFFASHALQQALRGEPAGADVVISNGVDDGLFMPMDRDVCRARLRLASGDSKVIGYFGSMEPVRGIQDLVDAISRLRDAGENLKLLLCGKPGAGIDLNLEWIIYRGLVPHAEVPVYINACDVVVLPYRQSALLDNAASCKIVEYLKCGRPLVSTRTPNFLDNFPNQAQMLGEGLCQPQDPAGLARAIAWQLREQRIVPAPVDATWEAIADVALESLCNGGAGRRLT